MRRPHPNLQCDRRGGVAVIRFDNPPVNALNNGIRATLDRLIDQLLADPATIGILFAGAGNGFVAGADIGELQHGVQPPFLGDMLRRIALSSKRSGAAIRGHAMVGGFEIALACDVRVATPDARIALPELRLALIPGAGGTQRLPRLIGTDAALDLMLSGRIVGATEALSLGLIDAIAEDDAETECLALMAAAPIVRHADLSTDALAAAAVRVAGDPTLADLPAATALLDAVGAALDSGADDAGFARERALFLACRNSSEATERIGAFVNGRNART